MTFVGYPAQNLIRADSLVFEWAGDSLRSWRRRQEDHSWSPKAANPEAAVVRKNSTTLMQRGPRGCTRGEVHSIQDALQLGLIGRNDTSDVANARDHRGRYGATIALAECLRRARVWRITDFPESAGEIIPHRAAG